MWLSLVLGDADLGIRASMRSSGCEAGVQRLLSRCERTKA
jgi:hypothetical protein